MKVAYISCFGRPCYEYAWFTHINAEKIKFLDVNFDAYPKSPKENIEYCKVNYTENQLLGKYFHSSARLIKYTDFEKYLEDVDVVMVLEIFSSLSRQFVEYCKKNKKKSVVIVYELLPMHPLYYLPTHIFNKQYVIRNADAFVCVSQKAADHAIALGAEAIKVKVVYPGVDLSVFYGRVPLNKRSGIIFVGGLKVHKGIDIFLELVDRLKQEYPDLNVTVVGDGNYALRVRAYAVKYENFKYLGRVENRLLPEILSQHSLYILPSREMKKYGIKVTSEQFGFSLVEAMACGLVVISSDCGAIPEVVTSNNFVCAQGSVDEPEAIARALLKDTARMEQIAGRNIAIAQERYDIVTQGEKLTNALQQI